MTLAYICIALAGFFFLMISALFGGGHDGDGDHDVSHDVGHDMSHDGGSIQHHWLSTKVLSAFATAFGAGGAICASRGVNGLISISVALACGFLVALAADFIITLFFSQQASSEFHSARLKGTIGTVTLTILANQTGEVRAQIGSAVVHKPARSETGEQIDQGSLVEILSAETIPLIVRKKA